MSAEVFRRGQNVGGRSFEVEKWCMKIEVRNSIWSHLRDLIGPKDQTISHFCGNLLNQISLDDFLILPFFEHWTLSSPLAGPMWGASSKWRVIPKPPCSHSASGRSWSFTVPLIKSWPGFMAPYCPTSHAFTAGIWSEIRQESTATSAQLSPLSFAGKWSGWGGKRTAVQCPRRRRQDDGWNSSQAQTNQWKYLHAWGWREGSWRPKASSLADIKGGLNHCDALIAYMFYKSCLYDKLITLSLTAAHSVGRKGAGLRGDGP